MREHKRKLLYFGYIGVAIGCMLSMKNIKVGITVIVCSGVVMLVYLLFTNKKRVKMKSCPVCSSKMGKSLRICPECGYIFEKAKEEQQALKEMDEGLQCSEEIDCDFEKIEQIAMGEVEAFDGDIEAFLSKREEEEAEKTKYM